MPVLFSLLKNMGALLPYPVRIVVGVGRVIARLLVFREESPDSTGQSAC